MRYEDWENISVQITGVWIFITSIISIIILMLRFLGANIMSSERLSTLAIQAAMVSIVIPMAICVSFRLIMKKISLNARQKVAKLTQELELRTKERKKIIDTRDRVLRKLDA